jgi:S-adenosylmethionine synthetase
MAEYLDSKQSIATAVRDTATVIASGVVEVAVNAADGSTPDSIYLTVTGTSAEAGDDGEAGRGNRVNGLIAPHRPMTMESVAGKNPVNHVGKLYNLCASLIADAIAREIPEVDLVECYMVSRIGRPINWPEIVEIRAARKGPTSTAMPETDIKRIVDRHLAELTEIPDQLISGTMRIGRWPLR